MPQNTVTNGPKYVVIAERRERATSEPEITTSKPVSRAKARSVLTRLIVAARKRRLPVVAEQEEITFAERTNSETSVTVYIKRA